jgi:hypothetical protein
MAFLPNSTAFPDSLADSCCDGLGQLDGKSDVSPSSEVGGGCDWMIDRLPPQPATLLWDETLDWGTRGVNPPIADWVIEPTEEGDVEFGIGTGGVGLGPGQPGDRADRYDSLTSAIDWGLLGSSSLQNRNRFTLDDRLDYYRLSLDHASRLEIGLESIGSGAIGSGAIGPAPTITLLDAQGVAIEPAKLQSNGTTRQIDLARGDYYLKVTAPEGVVSSDYQLKASAQSIAEWSMLVYMAADNNLETYGLKDFLEMAEVGSTRDVTIAVTLDRAKGYSTDYGDWTSTKRGLVQKGDRPTATWGKDLGEQNMGSARTLSNFLAWGLDAAPALRYELVIWNHGGGWNRIATDETSLGDALSATELTTALAPVQKLDIIGADACYMGMVEFAYQLRSEADYFVGASAAEQADGWNYSTLLRDLNANPIANTRTVAQSIVTSDRRQTANWTLSAIDLASLDNLNQSINQLVDSLIRPIGSEALTPTQALPIVNALKSARAKALAFGADSLGFRDLGQFLQELAGNSSLTAKQRSAARSAQARYGEAIVANSSSKGSTGLSIYCPSIGSLPIDSRYNASNQQFAANGRWDELLQWWQTNASPGRSTSPVPGQVATVSNGGDRLEIESGEIESSEIERLGMA